MDTLKDTKVGDFVAVWSSLTRKTVKREVTRTTAAQVIIGTGSNEVRFMRSSGNKVGSEKWDRTSAEPWTERHDQVVAAAALLDEQKRVAMATIRALEAGMQNMREVAYMSRPMPAEDFEKFVAFAREVTARLDAWKAAKGDAGKVKV